MRTLVTGGAGFIGSHLVEALLAQGHHITVVDNYTTSSNGNLRDLAMARRLKIVECDVRDLDIRRHDQIYHLASPASPEDYWRDPITTLLTNAIGTWQALEAARRWHARFLLASTSEVYGDPLQHPQRETYVGNVDPVGPRSAYDEGKRYAEALTMAYVRAEKVDARIVRIFNAYGPRMRPNDGRMPSEFIGNALRGTPIAVHGRGLQTRSLCFVTDTAAGLIAAMGRGRRGEIYNIGRPDEVSVLEFALKVKRLTRSPSPVRFVPGRESDIRRRRPDIRKAIRELRWRPTITLTNGLRMTLEWYREQQSLELPATRRLERSPTGPPPPAVRPRTTSAA